MAIISPDYFSLDEKVSSDFGVYVDSPPMPPMAERSVTTSEFDKNHESVIFKKNYFKDITVVLNCYLFEKMSDPRSFYSWLQTSEKLRMSRYSNFYYRIKYVKSIKPSYRGSNINQINIEFVCSPYRYAIKNPFIIKYLGTEGWANIKNEGSVPTSPIITIKPTNRFFSVESIFQSNHIRADTTGDFYFSTFDVFATKVTIDCEKKITYTQDKELLKTFGDYPILRVGTTEIHSWIPSETTFDIKERYI